MVAASRKILSLHNSFFVMGRSCTYHWGAEEPNRQPCNRCMQAKSAIQNDLYDAKQDAPDGICKHVVHACECGGSLPGVFCRR